MWPQKKNHFDLVTLIEKIIKHPQLNLIVSKSDEAYLRASLSYIYFREATTLVSTKERMYKEFDDKFKKGLTYFISNVSFIRTNQNAYMYIFSEVYLCVFSHLIEYNDEIKDIHLLKDEFKKDLEKVTFKNEIIISLFKLASLFILKDYVNLSEIENDPRQKWRFTRYLNYFQNFIVILANSGHKLSIKELDHIFNFISTLLITNENDLFEKAIEIIKLLHINNIFEEYPFYFHALSLILKVHKIDLASHFPTNKMIVATNTSKAYLKVLESYAFNIKHYPNIEFLNESLNFFVQNKNILLNRENIQQNDLKIIETWIYDSVSAFTSDNQYKVICLLGNMLLTECTEIDSEIFINLYSTIIFAHVFSDFTSYFKVVHIQMFHSHFIQMAFLEPRYRVSTNSVNLTTLNVLYALHERSDFTKKASGISLLDNPYPAFTEFYAICLQQIPMDYLRTCFTQSTLCLSIYSNFQKYGEHHMHLGTLAAYFDFFKKMILTRSPEDHNVEEDRKILTDGVNIYSKFYDSLNYNERIKLDVIYNSFIKYLEENTIQISYFKILAKEMSEAIKAIQINTTKLKKPTSRNKPKGITLQFMKNGIQAVLNAKK